MESPAYLSDPAFSEEHRGAPLVDANGVEHGRDPSPLQIRRMAEAIRRHVPRQMVGESCLPFTMPTASELVFNVRSVDRFL
jgi:hypothetical protein